MYFFLHWQLIFFSYEKDNVIISDILKTFYFLVSELFLKWNNTQSRIVHANILSSNGLIHIIDKLFIDLPEMPTTVSPKGTTKKSSHTNGSESVLIFHSFYTIVLTIFVILLT